jgi:hypothetical protein
MYNSDETVQVKITLTREQFDWLEARVPNGIGAGFRGLTDLAMRIESGEMDDKYSPELWQHFTGMVRELRLDLKRRRGGE